ncbi:MAG TPA: diaminopimelate dehydrogenase, partial [Actinomycetales bacterium]|nr:diaminopimelate dehydrogenase [Actinomycetales bacterium]
MSIRIGIAGYGNLGRGVELAVDASGDMTLAGIFTRRDPAAITPQLPGVPVFSWDDLTSKQNEIDVLILCGGSKTDLPEQGPQLAGLFHTVDSFDTHAEVPNYFGIMDAASQASGHVALIATGWDPGLFSLNRVMAEAVVPHGVTYTFWGRGLSQGHSDAVRRVP